MKSPLIRYALPILMATSLVLLLTACGEGGADAANGESISPLPQTAAERGLALVTANACIACHALDGSRGIGPSWRVSAGSISGSIYGTTRTFNDGSSAVVDDAYLRLSMLEPAAQVVEGFDSIMLPAAVTEEQIADIIAFIKELGSAMAP